MNRYDRLFNSKWLNSRSLSKREAGHYCKDPKGKNKEGKEYSTSFSTQEKNLCWKNNSKFVLLESIMWFLFTNSVTMPSEAIRYHGLNAPYMLATVLSNCTCITHSVLTSDEWRYYYTRYRWNWDRKWAICQLTK